MMNVYFYVCWVVTGAKKPRVYKKAHCKILGFVAYYMPKLLRSFEIVGGIWNYSEQVKPNQGAASFRNLVTNTSKETMAFSDFPMPEHYAQFMPNSQYLQYLRDYAKHFGLVKYMRFGTRVLNVAKPADYDETGCWKVHTE